MTMPWFVWVYGKVMAFYVYADEIVAPYKEAALELTREWRRRAAAVLRRLPGARGVKAQYQGLRARKG